MTDLTPNHPAVEAAHSATDAWMDDVQHKLPNDQMVHVLDTALPHLTADDLRNTPAGRALMAEGWEEGAQAAWERSGEGWNSEYTGRPEPTGVFRAQNPTYPSNPHLEADA